MFLCTHFHINYRNQASSNNLVLHLVLGVSLGTRMQSAQERKNCPASCGYGDSSLEIFSRLSAIDF